uniref:DNA pilot protein n=1 Tax=Dulem virus 264 TaxID=3145741 RepID=A0AAU8B258_9VIRU
MSWFSNVWKGVKNVAGGVLGSAGSIASVIPGVGPIGGAVIGALGSGISGSMAASESAEAVEAARQWQSVENEKQRNWQSSENQVSRDFNAQQAQIGRDWQTQERTAIQKYNSPVEQAQRMREAGLNPFSGTDSGASVPVSQGSTASSAPVSAGMSSAPSVIDPSASRAASSEVIKNLAEASSASAGSERVRALLDGEITGQQWDNVIKRQTAAAQAMTNLHLPESIQSRIFVDLTNGFKNMRSMKEMDAHIDALLKKAGLDDAQRAYIQFALSPYMTELTNYYKASTGKVNEEAETVRQLRPAQVSEAWSVVRKNNADAYATYARLDAEINALNADASYKKALSSYNTLCYNIRNANSNYEVAATAEQFLNVIQNSEDISASEKKHMQALAEKARKDSNHANAEFWRRQIVSYGGMLIQAVGVGASLATGASVTPPMMPGYPAPY